MKAHVSGLGSAAVQVEGEVGWSCPRAQPNPCQGRQVKLEEAISVGEQQELMGFGIVFC